MMPITLDQLGTDDDPCFGKHYDSSAPECQRCGDSELCLIKQAQLNSLTRAKIEEQQRFKDIEPEELKLNTHQIYQWIVANAFTRSKKVKLTSITTKVAKEYRLTKEFSKLEVTTLIRKIATQAVDLSIVSIDDIKYLKLKK